MSADSTTVPPTSVLRGFDEGILRQEGGREEKFLN